MLNAFVEKEGRGFSHEFEKRRMEKENQLRR